MSTERENDKRLCSWKEIAVYLKSGVRTCSRWEKELGLPVHRMEGFPKSRIFAYPDELDRWLKTRLNLKKNVQKFYIIPFDWKRMTFGIVGLLICITLVVFGYQKFFLPSPFKLSDKNIITAEPDGDGRLRIWGNKSENLYHNIWTAEKVRHSSVALGDLDDDGKNEIAVLESCQVTGIENAQKIQYYKIFLNIYKPGKRNVWKSTIGSENDWILEQRNFYSNDILIADIDGKSPDEVVCITSNWLAVFRYIKETDNFQMIREIDTFVKDSPITLQSLAIDDIDNEGLPEILISANKTGKNANFSWIFLFNFEYDYPMLKSTWEIDYLVRRRSLKTGDVIPGGDKEILTAAYRRTDTQYSGYILGLDSSGNRIIENQISESEASNASSISLDIGEIDQEPGEEIVVARNRPTQLILFKWENGMLSEKTRTILDDRQIGISQICIADSDRSPDCLNEIIAGGVRSLIQENSGTFYLEVFGFDKQFFSKWIRLGGDAGEFEPWFVVAGGRKR